MSEKRKPALTMLLRKGSTTAKLEFFSQDLWPEHPYQHRTGQECYRIRANGRWFPKDVRYAFFTVHEICESLEQTIETLLKGE